jgi:hypothetical protein
LAISWLASWVTRLTGGPQEVAPGAGTTVANLGGLLLLLHFALAAVRQGFIFAGRPMQARGLGRITALQAATTPAEVGEVFATWRRKLTPRGLLEPDEPTPAERVRVVVGDALWRDTIGLVPLYAIALTFALWVGASQLEWTFLERAPFGIALWVALPLGGAVADWVENLLHLSYVRRFAERGVPPGWEVFLCRGATIVKTLAFVAAAVLSVAIWLWTCGLVLFFSSGLGWRGIVAGMVPILGVLSALAVAVRLMRKRYLRQVQAITPGEEDGGEA